MLHLHFPLLVSWLFTLSLAMDFEQRPSTSASLMYVQLLLFIKDDLRLFILAAILLLPARRLSFRRGDGGRGVRLGKTRAHVPQPAPELSLPAACTAVLCNYAVIPK